MSEQLILRLEVEGQSVDPFQSIRTFCFTLDDQLGRKCYQREQTNTLWCYLSHLLQQC